MRHPIRLGIALSSVVFVAAACAARAPGTRPDDMSAAAHRKQAEGHDRAAVRHAGRSDPQAPRPGDGTHVEPLVNRGFEYESAMHEAADEHTEQGAAHREHARQHRAAAAALERFADYQCAGFPPGARSECPLLAVVVGVEPIEHGVRFVLARGVPVRAAADHFRCHQAFARVQGFKGMAECALYLPRLTIEVENDRSIAVTSIYAGVVAELRKRAGLPAPRPESPPLP